MKVFVILEHFCDGDPACGVSNSVDMLCNTLAQYGCEVGTFFYDEARGLKAKAATDWQRMVDEARAFAPDFVVLSVMGDDWAPPREFIRRISEFVPVVAIHYDTISDWSIVQAYLNCVTLSVILDATPFCELSDEIIKLWTPVDAELYEPDIEKLAFENYPHKFLASQLGRKSDVSFAGTPWAARGEYVNRLKGSEWKVEVSGGQHVALDHYELLTKQDYAALMKRSKMVLNGTSGQMKGRVFEATAAGALLLEERNKETSRYFDDGRDCVMFDGADDLLEKVRIMHVDRNQRSWISLMGYYRTRDSLSSRKFWSRILERLQLLKRKDFAIVLASRERPALLEQLLKSVQLRTERCESVETLVGYDLCDESMKSPQIERWRKIYPFAEFFPRPRSGNMHADYINWLWGKSFARNIIICNDDSVFLTDGWDDIARSRLDAYLKDKSDGIAYGWIADNLRHRGGGYCCFPLVTDKAADVLGYAMHPGYTTWGADNGLWETFNRAQRICDLRDIVIDHDSHHNDGTDGKPKRDRDAVNRAMESRVWVHDRVDMHGDGRLLLRRIANQNAPPPNITARDLCAWCCSMQPAMFVVAGNGQRHVFCCESHRDSYSHAHKVRFD